ncbi:2TM domain-containing protein [Halpernia frigidisoli]|uniref:2TM domain-containing protein n=1 Tax=Halpernia frigidisoli TaxID=1125876 RepID=A0A1I3GZA4_9FLAO|nr:2TM domain-containing protein [Halpernia frigidisoli]SFI28632.1 2TM domain-containing protein [Halpernia frigidisoli]
METNNSDEIKYRQAKKKVEKIKGFYIHFLVYVCVNLLIAYFNYQDLKPGESYFQYQNFLTAFFWGIGLAAHGISVFMPNFIFGNDWEERKIQELMDKYK